MKMLLLVLFSGVSISASAVNLACFNKNVIGPAPLLISVDAKGAVLSNQGQACNMLPIPYNPRSGKYDGWVRTGTKSPFCPTLGRVMFGDGQNSNKGLDLYWVSYSPETQEGKEGWVQVGYQNVWDPGAGPEMKSMLRCFPPRK